MIELVDSDSGPDSANTFLSSAITPSTRTGSNITPPKFTRFKKAAGVSCAPTPIKAEASSDVVIVEPDPNDLFHLPPFARAAWVATFLPTLYHKFGASQEVFKHFCKCDEFTEIVQEVVKRVWPTVDYKVVWGDKICSAVRGNQYLFICIYIKQQITGIL